MTFKKATWVNAGKYTILVPGTSFDFLSLDKDTYEISFRAVRFKVKCDTYVTVVTNLSREEFPADDIQRLYRLRWGEETSFRDLNYNLGTVNFHSKDKNYIKQELYAKLTAYNYCAFIAYRVRLKKSERRKHHYKINFATAVNICMAYFRKGGDDNELMMLLARQLTPIRPNRRYPLNIRAKRSKGFSYRTA